MSKKSKAQKHATRVRLQKKKSRPNPLLLGENFFTEREKNKLSGYTPELTEQLTEIAFDQMLLHILKISGIRDALLKHMKNAPTKKIKEEESDTIQ